MRLRNKKWGVRFILSIVVIIFIAASAFAQESSYNKALDAYAQKDFKNVVKYLTVYIEQKPDPYAYYLLGYANYKLKNHAEAMKYFNDAYVIDPTFSPPPFMK